MARQEGKTSKSLSERLRSHLASPPKNAPAHDLEPGTAQPSEASSERPFSTIARVMSEGRAGGAPQSRAAAIVHQILEKVEEQPGCDVHQLAGWLGEKSIFILSHVDDLAREGVLLRLENGRLFRSRDFLPVVEEESPEPAAERTGHPEHKAQAQLELARICLRVFRFLTSELGVEPECGPKMTVQFDSGKFFEMRGSQGRANISLYGMFPKELVERFKRTSNFDRRQLNYSHLTGIIDIRGCRYQDLESLFPWVAEFYRSQYPDRGLLEKR